MDAFNHRFNQTELDQGHVPKELQELGRQVCTILFCVSIGCCVLVLLGYAFIRYFDPAHDRLTLRLLIYATIAHIILGIAGIFRINAPTRDNGAGCQAVMFFYVSSNLFSTIAITCIAVNLQIVFVHDMKSHDHLERWYFLASLLPAIIIAIIPIFPKVEGYDYNKHMGDCWYLQSSDHVTSLWALMGLYIWILISTAYCIIALIMVLWKMCTEELRINQHLRSQPIRHHERHHKWFYHWPLSMCFRPPRRDPISLALDQLEEPQGEQQDHHDHHLPPRPSNLRRLFSSGMQLTLKNIRLVRLRQLEMSYLAKVAGRIIWFPVSEYKKHYTCEHRALTANCILQFLF
ncbi:hypothetical protein BJV82DRAFT_664734 [Fennellomyces sp. T-0311]|nr:hypothetical protein BJV82DRAFT_664734 [Fennellomyces sp. T-0311]